MLPDFPRKLYRKLKKEKKLFKEICPGIKVEDRENLETLGSPKGANARRVLLNIILEPNGPTRTDGKRPDGITLAPWEEGKQSVWDVTCVDLLAPSRIEKGSVANPGAAAEEAEELKTAKYVCLTDKGYIFQPLAFKFQSTFWKNLCKKLCVFNQDSLAIQAGNAVSVFGTVRDEDLLSELYYL